MLVKECDEICCQASDGWLASRYEKKAFAREDCLAGTDLLDRSLSNSSRVVEENITRTTVIII